MSDFNLYSVNWQDGMLVTQQHLREQEHFCVETARWYAHRVADQYGLVRKAFSGKPALSLNMAVNGDRVAIDVLRCQGLTPDGSIIEINDSTGVAVRGEARFGSSAMPVYLTVDSKNRRAVGDPDPDEDIPRVPYLVNNYRVVIGEEPSSVAGSYLQIAELVVNGNDVAHSEAFYPPCLSLYADERLTKKAQDYRNRLDNLLSLSSRAFAAIAADGALDGASSGLQTAFRTTVYQIATFLASSIDEFQVGRNAGHPMSLVITFKRLFRVFSTLLNLHPGLKDYLNERFFLKEVGVDVGTFLSRVDAFLLSEYRHDNLGSHIAEIDDILGTIRGMMGFLAQVKKDQLGDQAMATETLTYRGQTYRVVEYSASRLEQAGELSYLMVDVSDTRAISDIVILMNKDLMSVAEWGRVQVRLGMNEARGLGETDPVDVDAVTFGNKVALRPQDMLKSPSVNQVTLLFRGVKEPQKFDNLGKMDLILYHL